MARTTPPLTTPPATLGQRIQAARKARGMSQTDLARALGLAPQSVQQWEKDQNEPRRKRMGDLAATLGVTVAYLEHGSSGISGQSRRDIAERHDLDPWWPRDRSDLLERLGGRTFAPPLNANTGAASIHSNVESVSPGTQSGKVPLISWVQAGSWNEAIDNLHPGDAEAWLPCPVRHGPRTYALRVKGDSMTASYGKSYPEGCVIYVDPDQVGGVTTGDRVIAKLSGHDAVTFKSFVEDAGRRYLKPLNQAYPIIIDPFVILGKVILKVEFE